MEFFKNFFKLSRAYNLMFTLVSCFILYSYAHYVTTFNTVTFSVLVAIFCLIHLGANICNDYLQVKERLQKGEKLSEIRFNGFLPKAELILNKTFSISATRRIFNFLFVVSLGLALSLSLLICWKIIFLFIIGIVMSVLDGFASKHYCSEILSGLIFGPLMIMGGFYILIGGVEPRLLTLSFAVMFAVIAVSHAINIMNWEFDSADGRKTLALAVGTKRNALGLLNLFISIPYLIILVGVLSNEFNKTMLFVFLTLPIATKLISSMKEYVMVKNVEFKPRWYWGIFENWKAIKERGVDFYMFRVYLVRNYAILFSIIAAIGVMI